MVEEAAEPSQPIPELQLAPALPCVPEIMVAKKLHLQIPSQMLSKAGPFEQKMHPVMYKKDICSRAQFRDSARAQGFPDGGGAV